MSRFPNDLSRAFFFVLLALPLRPFTGAIYARREASRAAAKKSPSKAISNGTGSSSAVRKAGGDL